MDLHQIHSGILVFGEVMKSTGSTTEIQILLRLCTSIFHDFAFNYQQYISLCTFDSVCHVPTLPLTVANLAVPSLLPPCEDPPPPVPVQACRLLLQPVPVHLGVGGQVLQRVVAVQDLQHFNFKFNVLPVFLRPCFTWRSSAV